MQDSVLVDDFIVSGDDVHELSRTRKELEAALMPIGMQLHKMAANTPRVLEGVAPDRIAKTKLLGEEDSIDYPTSMPTIKTLGIVWNASADTVAIQFQPKYEDQGLSLRKVVSDGGRFYDMLGLGLPIAMTSRILQQLCWANSSQWDAPIPDELEAKWLQWLTNTKQVAQVSIPRAVKHKDSVLQKQRLIIFVDARCRGSGCSGLRPKPVSGWTTGCATPCSQGKGCFAPQTGKHSQARVRSRGSGRRAWRQARTHPTLES